MNNIINSREGILQDALKNIDLETVAKDTGLYQRQFRKATILQLTQSILYCAVNASWSFRQLAFQLGLIGGFKYSRQALHKRLNHNAVSYMRELLRQFMQCKLKIGTVSSKMHEFQRVIIQDSTCIALAPHLRSHFSGSANQSNKSFSLLRLQIVYDVISESFVRFSMSGYNRNDQAAATDVIDYCEKNDLILRDLGYFTLNSLQGIIDKGAFFVSRLHPIVNLFNADGESVNLLKLLRKKKSLDQVVFVGSNNRIALRIVATPVPKHITAERKRKAKMNRDKRCNPSPNRLALLGWQIFITNIPIENHPAEFITECYGIRWRIETLFKAYKQNFKLGSLPNGNINQLLVALYAKLILITITHHLYSIYSRQLPSISFMKFSQLIASIWHLLFDLNQNRDPKFDFCEMLLYHSSYDYRGRFNFTQSLHSLG